MKPKITWKAVVLPVIGVLAFLVYLYIFNVDIGEIIETARYVDLSVYFVSILFVFVETFFYALSRQSLLSFLSGRLSVVNACDNTNANPNLLA